MHQFRSEFVDHFEWNLCYNAFSVFSLPIFPPQFCAMHLVDEIFYSLQGFCHISWHIWTCEAEVVRDLPWKPKCFCSSGESTGLAKYQAARTKWPELQPSFDFFPPSFHNLYVNMAYITLDLRDDIVHTSLYILLLVKHETSL